MQRVYFLATFQQLINVFYSIVAISGVVCIASVPYPSCAYQSLKVSMDQYRWTSLHWSTVVSSVTNRKASSGPSLRCVMECTGRITGSMMQWYILSSGLVTECC